MSNHGASGNRQDSDSKQATRKEPRPGDTSGPAGGQGHQPLPGENPPTDGGQAKRKHIQNADLPPGKGHQTLPGEDAPPEDDEGRR